MDRETRLGKLRNLLVPETSEEDFGLIAELLSLPHEGLRALDDLSPQKKKARLLAALVRQLEALARSDPVLVIWEDVHWIDPSSRDLFELSLDWILRLPVLRLLSRFGRSFTRVGSDESM